MVYQNSVKSLKSSQSHSKSALRLPKKLKLQNTEIGVGTLNMTTDQNLTSKFKVTRNADLSGSRVMGSQSKLEIKSIKRIYCKKKGK